MRKLFASIAIATAITIGGAHAADVSIGFLSLDNDPRYDDQLTYARINLGATGNGLAGAQMGLEDSAMIAEATGMTLSLNAQSAADAAGLVARVQEMAAAGNRFIVTDLPGDVLNEVAAATRDLPVTLVNSSAHEDQLRAACYPNLLHTAASDRMLSDAMTQYLRLMNWTRILLLVGEEPRDQVIADSFRASAERLRLTIVETRPFTLATDPENREANNTALLTGGVDYDVVFLADSRGEYGRFLPYATQLPRPVLGSVGLVATEWHWSLERFGAPQVNSRFERENDNRRMSGEDFNAWMATKAIATAYARARSEDPAEVDAFLRGERLRVDGSKGVTMNFRPWDGQMREPIMLSTQNAVIAIAPLEGYLHQFNDLDTLGTDEPEHQCP